MTNLNHHQTRAEIDRRIELDMFTESSRAYTGEQFLEYTGAGGQLDYTIREDMESFCDYVDFNGIEDDARRDIARGIACDAIRGYWCELSRESGVVVTDSTRLRDLIPVEDE